MEKSKLINIMSTLSDAEVKDLGKFLEGTSYRKTGSVFTLFKYLKKWHPEFPLKKIEKEYVQKSLFKNADNASKRMLDVMSQLSIVLEDFLVKKQLEKNDIDRDFLLLNELKDRKLDKLFFQKMAGMEKTWEQEDIPGTEQLYRQYKMNNMVLLHPSYSRLEETPLNPHVLTESLDKFYFASKLYWTLCHHITYNTMDSKSLNEEQKLIEEIIEHTQSPKFQAIPQIQLFRKLAVDMFSNNFDNYSEIKNNFVENIALYNEAEKLDLFNFLMYYCIEIHKRGHPNSTQYLFDINKFAVEHQMVIHNDYIYPETYINITNIGCAANELEWVENFVSEYKTHLTDEFRLDAVTLCEATVAMNKEEFGAAIQKIAQVKFQNAIYGVQARCVQLQCFYELEDYDELFTNSIKSFAMFLNRNQIVSTIFKDSIKNFLTYAKKLKKYKDSKKNVPEEIYQQITEHKNIAWKNWLEKKSKELGIQ